jgi:hypothetical protein
VAVEDFNGQAVAVDLCNQPPAELAHLPTSVFRGDNTANRLAPRGSKVAWTSPLRYACPQPMEISDTVGIDGRPAQ